MTIKKIVFTSLIAMSMSTVSMFAHAGLVITNNTKQDSTSSIFGTCSTALPGGIVKAGEQNHKVDDITIGLACWGHESNCVADVYMTADCEKSGASKIATVVFDTSKGVRSVTMNSSQYTITAPIGGFFFQVDGGPSALASKK
jgi:hypothetical protein